MPELLTIDDATGLIGRAELEQVAGLGSFNTPEGRSLDEARIAQAIGFADDLIKSYLAKRYPFVTALAAADAPQLLKSYGADIVRYRLRLRSGDRNTVSEEVETRYNAAIAWLKDAARGIVNVDFSDAPDAVASEAASAAASPSGRTLAAGPAPRAAAALAGYREGWL